MAGFGGSIKLTGESEYKRAIREITDNLTVLSSEMKVVTSLYDSNDRSTENLAKQNDVLTKRLGEQNKKLAEAKKMLQEANSAENTNAQTIAKWQNEVNKAQAEVNKTTRELEKNTKQIKENDKAVDDLTKSVKTAGDEAGKSATGGFTVFKGILVNISTQVINGVINGLKAITTGLIDIGKQAVASYADYEQLVGGVETLYKDSAEQVQKYANEAYKTAGLSANRYMETITSFSASLLQSLGQDTEASAKLADQAIIDMADNANKMGTNIESIQSAYQGLAKGTFTMLDNLKLGYGGNRSEMQRLIDDANRVKEANGEMADLSIDSFANMVEAIHIIQTELGITGTTAKEASTTITGSVNAMKASWQNLLTGIADENADFSSLINNFIESIMTVADNMLPRITQTIKGMGQLVSELISAIIPEIVGEIPALINETLPTITTALETAINGVMAVLPQIVEAIKNVLPLILETIIGMLPNIAEAGIQIILSIIDGISGAIPTLIPAIVKAVLTIVNNILANIPALINAGMELIKALAQGIVDAIPVIIEALPTIIENIINGLNELMPALIQTGIELIIQISIGLIKAIPILIAKIPEIIVAIIKGFTSYFTDFKQVGADILGGIWQGMKDYMATLWQGVKNIANTIVGWFKDLFGIHSPSQVFADTIGKNLALGIGAGFENTMSEVNSQMADAINTDFAFETKATAPTQTIDAYKQMVDAFKEALTEVNIVLDDEVAGKFVTETVERVVYN